MRTGSYGYDILGRLTQKTEKDTTLDYIYPEGSYQPGSVSVNGVSMDRALLYDAAGNLWMDNHKHVTYKINALGLPERVAVYDGPVPATVDLAQVEASASDVSRIDPREVAYVRMAYDETGTRIWESRANRGNYLGSEVTVPGVGVYGRDRFHGFGPSRLDLVNGGYRNGKDGAALFPVTDAQGNVRGYAGAGGLQTVYAYYPFGTAVDIAENSSADERRWQSKEYDGDHNKYYFGARYFDPFFGLWTSPDPAGQYADPYTYGGDPLNYADPTGMWSLGVGLVFGWDKSHGWNVGVESSPFSYSWNQDGSGSFNVGVHGDYQFYILNLGGSLGYSYNTYTGHALSADGTACIGVKEGDAGLCAGVEAGGGLHWDPHGNFLGATVYSGVFAEARLNEEASLKVHGGYEWGFLGMEGRGFYVGGDIGGLNAEWSRNGGWNYGFEALRYDLKNERVTLFGLLSLDQNLLAADVYDRTNPTADQVGSIMEEDGDGVVSVVTHGNQDGTIQWEGESWEAEDFYDQVLSKKITSKTKEIDLYVCLGGYGGKNSFAQKLAEVSNLQVRAAIGYVRPVVFSVLGQVLMTYDRNRLVGDSRKKGNVIVNAPKWDYFYAGKYK